MEQKDLYNLLEELIKQPKESEWVEFKENYHSAEEIGEAISALANGASLYNNQFGYMIFGVQDSPQMVTGTEFKFSKKKKGKEELENWILQRLAPRIDFRYYEFDYKGKDVVIIEIPSAVSQPVRFINIAYIRVGSYTRKLVEFPDKEKKLWEKKLEKAFEKGIAIRLTDADGVVSLLDTQAYFDLLSLPYPTSRSAVLEKLENERFIKKLTSGYSVTNLGGILFAKDINNFPTLSRKAVRVIVYKGNNRINTEREQPGAKGYAVGFNNLVNWVNDRLPANEEIGRAFREDVRMYPEIAIRELAANALIHQDFNETGIGPIIEIFSDRIEFTNPGLPLIKTSRFIDEFQSRNEDLAAFMRRIKICEEKGSGIDKVIFNVELYQLPAPDFQAKEKNTKVILYGYKTLNDMDKKDKIRACYQHACLCYVSNEKMSNQSLRERFKIDEKNAAIASRIIKDTLGANLIKEDDPDSNSRKYAKYIPFWA
ncbi:MAG TPA: putative DNA binding domain-containing protein [Draconibacterium sp.]|nr:putative DNA binding domain-containing protein [Draconibacterium sp.]